MKFTVAQSLAVLVLFVGACSSTPKPSSSGLNWSVVQDSTQVLMSIEGLKGPEAVRYDAEQDVYFIANFNGGGNVLDSNGFITRAKADGSIENMEFMVGTEAFPMHAPRGMFIVGNSLYAADAQGVHEFDKTTGEQLGFVDFMSLKPGFLNDISADADGNLYVTDTGKTAVYKISNKVPNILIDDLPVYPNGITLNPATSQFVLGSWRADTLIYSFNTDMVVSLFADLEGGNYDGLEFIGDDLIITSQVDSTIRQYSPGMGDRVIIHTPGRPADIGIDTQRLRIAIPYIAKDRVDIWDLSKN